MMRPALHVLDAVALELRLELGAAAPAGVLPALVGQDFSWRPVRCNPPRQRLEHQHASLVMRHDEAHQVARVIVQERRHIDALVAPQQEREDVRLPQLVRLGTLEALYLTLPAYPPSGYLRLNAFGSQHPSHRRLGGADP
jgi:hypothetical protein